MAAGQYSGGIGAIFGAIIGAIVMENPYAGASLGASLGSVAGGLAGQIFWPEKQDLYHPPPPKPGENRVQISTYGAPIPVLYGDGKLAGNIVYMSDIAETVNRSRHRQEGVRYYEMEKLYTSTFAICFCEAVGGKSVARIWVNGKVFADYRDPAGEYYPSGDSALAEANLETSVARGEVWFSVYDGTQTTHDAALAAILGAAETPVYKGLLYVVFRDFPVGEFGGIPNVEIEVADRVVV